MDADYKSNVLKKYIKMIIELAMGWKLEIIDLM